MICPHCEVTDMGSMHVWACGRALTVMRVFLAPYRWMRGVVKAVRR